MSSAFLAIFGQSICEDGMDKIKAQVDETPLGYDEAKAQFIKLTEELGLKHAFTFDEAWEASKEIRKRNEHREKLKTFQEKLQNNEASYVEGEVEKHNPLKHSFAEGMYIREIINPPGHIIVTKIHKQKHPFFLMSGEMSVLTDEGVTKLVGPHYGITEAGTKRIIYTHTECKFVTVHLTDKTDLHDIEEEVIASDFSDPKLETEDAERLKELIG